jgi:2-polyprenyl-6-methoxyphenol hydroxylase-like FAD-dependent oxidoreductase
VDVIIVGAGIGGLVTALALHRIGINARIYESVAELRPLGVGINLLPHATKVLGQLGLIDALAEVSVATRELIYLNKLGQEIWREPRGHEAGYAWPQLSIHRGELQMVLLRAVRERLGDERIRTGHHFAKVDQIANDRVRATFVRRATGETIAEDTADLLIGADGIHSAVRAQLYPNEGPPKWNGILLLRATSQAPAIHSGREMVAIGYSGYRFVAYPILRRDADAVQPLINWIAEVGQDASGSFRREDWNRPGTIADVLPRYERWVFDWLDVPSVMRAADAVYEYPYVDRDPVERWTFGRVTLLGDAAHPMYPMGSNGGSQAILDARALADALTQEPDIDRALAAYEAARRPPTAALVHSNRRQGPSEIQTIVEQRAPNGFERIESVLSPAELAEISARYKRLAGFDQATVNTP